MGTNRFSLTDNVSVKLNTGLQSVVAVDVGKRIDQTMKHKDNFLRDLKT